MIYHLSVRGAQSCRGHDSGGTMTIKLLQQCRRKNGQILPFADNDPKCKDCTILNTNTHYIPGHSSTKQGKTPIASPGTNHVNFLELHASLRGTRVHVNLFSYCQTYPTLIPSALCTIKVWVISSKASTRNIYSAGGGGRAPGNQRSGQMRYT